MTNPATPFSGPQLCALSAREAVALLKRGEVSPGEMIDAAMARIGAVEPAVNAVVTTCADRAREAAGRLPADAARNGREPGWLAGLPITIKDLDAVAGVRCTSGNAALADFVPERSDPLVERLESRGGLVIGKTNTPEFGAGANTFNEVFGPTRNPWDTRRNAGGSSGGAAVSLATGEAWLSHGSDYGGSLRTPAAYCGVVGLRPTPGRCGGSPSEIAFTLESVSGPMARDVGDIALFLDAMTGYDPREPITIEAPAISFQEAVTRADGKVRIAFSEDLGGYAPVEREMRTILRRAMERTSANGAVVEEACPSLPGLEETFRTLRGLSFAATYPHKPQAVRDRFKRTLRENVESGGRITLDEICFAMRQRTVLYQTMREFLSARDVLAIPVVGLEPGLVEEEYPPAVDGQPMRDYIDWLRFAFLATVTTLPAISVPVGFTASGMPVGIQLVGPPRGEARLLQVARAVEEAVQFPRTPIDPVVRHKG
jgi:amidase